MPVNAIAEGCVTGELYYFLLSILEYTSSGYLHNYYLIGNGCTFECQHLSLNEYYSISNALTHLLASCKYGEVASNVTQGVEQLVTLLYKIKGVSS